MNRVALEVITTKEEPIVLDYAKPEKPRRKWYHPLNYKGAMVGLGYSLLWPGITYSYLYGFDCIYDKYFPNGSIQDNFIYSTLKIPSEFVLSNIERLTRNANLDAEPILMIYLASWALAGHIIERTISLTKKKRSRKS